MSTQKDQNDATMQIGSALNTGNAADGDTSQILSSDSAQTSQDGQTKFMSSHQQNAPAVDSSQLTKPIVSGLYLGSKIKDRYLIERELGRGGIGVVYLARDTQLMSRPVVIKILLEESSQNDWFKKKFYQEMEALARLDHPGIVGVLDAGQLSDGKPYLVMQFIEGESLRHVMKYEEMNLKRVGNIIRQICHALTAAHDKGIYHRDLKPENIMVQQEDQIKIIDFGIATVKDSQVATTKDTTTVAGTAWYMAPEQLMGKPTAASDIYAAGVIAYELVTGHRPFNPETPYQLLGMQKEGLKALPCELCHALPEAADEAIVRALAFDPADRFARARDFGDELARALTEPAPGVAAATRKMNQGRPTAQQDAAETAEPRPPMQARATVAVAPALAYVESAPLAPAKPPTVRYLAIGLAVVLLLGGAFGVYKMLNRQPTPTSTNATSNNVTSVATTPAPPPLLTTEIYDEFLNLNKWVVPASGWTVDPRRNALEISNQPEPGYLKDVNCENFTMTFQLKLLESAGAAWTLRMKDDKNYYLFYLSGPDGQIPNRLLTYIVRDGKFTPTNFDNSLGFPTRIKKGGEYNIEIKVEKNTFFHKIRDENTGEEYKLAMWTDANNTYPTGGVGFRTIGAEHFVIDDLYVRPPGIQAPK
jgi:predicted Ser/Thr protein kinase